MNLKKLLDNIVELPGVDGLCVISPDSELHVHHLPREIDATMLSQAVAPLASVLHAGEASMPGHDDQVLLFGAQWVVLRRCGAGTLLLIGHESANLSSVRLVSNLALRELTAEAMQDFLQAAEAKAQVARELEEAAFMPQAAPDVSNVTGPRMYRGRPY